MLYSLLKVDYNGIRKLAIHLNQPKELFMSNVTYKAAMSDLFLNELATIVEEEKRIDFLPAKFAGYLMAVLSFETNIYHQASKMDENYTGGYWEFADCANNKGFFMYPDTDDSLHLHNINSYEEYEVDGRIFGLIASLMVFSNASFAFYEKAPKLSQLFAEHYHATRNAFYDAVDKIAYSKDSSVSEEEKQQVKDMSAIVTRYLD